MKVSEMYPSRFMKAEDFEEGETRIFTIKNVEMEELGQGKEKQEKPVLQFREPDTKEFVLNKTNAANIAKLYGDDTDDWLGKRIELYTLEVDSFGDVVRAIRVKTKVPKGAQAPAPSRTRDEQAPAGNEDWFGKYEGDALAAETAPAPKPNGAPAAPEVGNFGPGVQTSKATKESYFGFANAHGIGNIAVTIRNKFTRNGVTDWQAAMNELAPQVK